MTSRRDPDEAARYLISPTPEQLDLMRESWRIGDVRPVELEFGITYDHPRFFWDRSSLENELAEMIEEARIWIATLAERAGIAH